MPRLRPVRLLASATLLLMAPVVAAAPLGATALSPLIDLQEAGLTTAADGEGLQGWDRVTPVTLTVDVLGPVRFALLYWAGSDAPCNTFDGTSCTVVQPYEDQQMVFDGANLTGTVIGTETWAEDPQGSRLAIGYLADVTSLVSDNGVGTHSFTFADQDLSSNLTDLDGVGLIVAYTHPDDGNVFRVIVWDGLDLASGLAAPGEAHSTSPVGFPHGAAAEIRQAELTLIAGDGDASCDRVTASGNPILVNTLDGSSGPEWDVDTHQLLILPGVSTTEVQVFAEPDDLLWQVAMLRLFVPPVPDQSAEATVSGLGLEPTIGAGVSGPPPTCSLTSLDFGPPAVATITFGTTSRVGSIEVIESVNADVQVPPTTGEIQVEVTITKIDPSQPMSAEFFARNPFGDGAACTYREGSLTIVKDTVPDAAQDFTFLGSQWMGTFLLDDDGGGDATLPSSRSFFLPEGPYCISEALLDGFELNAIVCEDPTADSTGDVPGRTAHASVAANEEVTCTFTNADVRPGNVVIAQNTVPDAPQDFAFAGTAPIGGFVLDDDGGADPTLASSATFALPAGTYTVTQAAGAFPLVGVTCSDGDSVGDPGSRTATVVVAPGETVTCTFANADTQLATVPTLREWAMAVLGLGLAALGIWRIRTSG